MNLNIPNLSVERFRSLRKIKLEGLGRVNLITGKNNTGKSSLLEALRIFATDASTSVIADILWYREENLRESDAGLGASASPSGNSVEGLVESIEGANATGAETPSLISNLFSGFPSLEKIHDPIVISAGAGAKMQLSMSVRWFSAIRQPDGTRRLVEEQPQLFSDAERIPALVIDGASGNKLVSLDSLRASKILNRRLILSGRVEEPRMPCVYVSPYGSEHTAALVPLWDKIALTDYEVDVVDALRIVTDDITNVSMVAGANGSQSRMAIVKLRGHSRPLPLRSFGDGLNRLFGIILSLVNAKGGLLLIDEVENGMHHSLQADVWRVIFRLSKRLNIQVFATSHSWDSVQAFQKSAVDDPEAGVLIRLSRKNDDVISTLFRENELRVVTSEKIEVR